MRPVLFAGLLLPLVAAPELTGVTVEPGTKVTKSFLNSLNIELVDMEFSIDGEEQELPAEAKPQVTISDEEEIVFVDEYVKVADGRGVEIVRTYETLSDESSQVVVPPGGEEMEQAESGESDLLDQSVRFVWDAEEETYEVTFVEEDGDESLLEGLDGDADYLYLLSDEEMEAGSTWEVDPVAFDRISSPSGDLKINGDDDDAETDSNFSESFRDNLDGEITATIDSIEEGIATISYEGEVMTTFEMEGTEGEAPPQEFDFTFEVSGKLLWDMKAGHPSEFQFGGDVEMSISVTGDFNGAEVIQKQIFEGEYESAATFE